MALNVQERKHLKHVSNAAEFSGLAAYVDKIADFKICVKPRKDKVLFSTWCLKKTLSYDPAKSETFRALQEAELGDQVQEVTVPVQPRVFSPAAQAKRTPGPQVVYQHKVAAAHNVNHMNSIGQHDESIHQSGSFKRLMNQVLGESVY